MEQTFQFLTTRELILRKFMDLFAPLYATRAKISAIIVPGYSLLKNLTALSSGTSALIGVFMKNDTKAKVFIKKYIFQAKGLRYASLINELGILQLLSSKQLTKVEKFNVVIPALKKVIKKDNEITIICEYVEGEPLLNRDEKTKVETLIKVFGAMKFINKQIQGDLPLLPKRNANVLAVTFLYFWIKLIVKEPNKFGQNMYLLLNFYKNYFLTLGAKNTYGLVHRDLHSRNILLNNNNIIITDWEGAVISDSWYDLAMVSRLYMHELSTETTIKLLNTLLETETDKRRFIFSLIFYTVQTLGVDKKDAKSYIDAANYISVLQKDITPQLLTN